MYKSKIIRHVIVGCGSVSDAHAEAFSGWDDVELYCAVDSNIDRAERLASRFGIPRAFTDLQSILNDNLVTSLSIALPHDLHAPVAERAIHAGKHILMEKPFALSSIQARRIADL